MPNTMTPPSCPPVTTSDSSFGSTDRAVTPFFVVECSGWQPVSVYSARSATLASDGGAFLRLRFVSEANYNSMWSAGGADLNQDGDTTDGIQRDGSGSTAGPDYLLYPLLIEVHWADEGGDHVLRYTTVIASEPELDPDRS